MPFGFDEFLANYGPYDPRNPWRLTALQAGTPENPIAPRTDPVMPPLPPEPDTPPERDPSLLIPPTRVRTVRVGPDGNVINPAAPAPDMPPTLPSVGPTTPREPERMAPLTPSTFDPAPTSGRTPEIKTGIVADERLTSSPGTADSYMEAMQKALQNKQFNQALADIGSAFKKKPAGDFGSMPVAPQVGRASGVNPGAALKGVGTAMMGKYIDSLGEKRSQILAKGKKKHAPLRPYRG